MSADITGLSINTTYHCRVVATNSDGTTYGSNMTFTTPPITITITSPTDGSTINRPDVMVKGSLITPGNETGVTVSGIVGMVYGSDFAINHVPLSDGTNTISVTATDTAGNTATTAITVTADTSQPYVTLTASPESGVAPLTVSFSASAAISNGVTSYQIDFDGDVVDDYSDTTFDNVSHLYSSQGIYYVTLTVVDAAATSYRDTIAIMVVNANDLDALLRAKWIAVTTALGNKDVSTAIALISPATRTVYQLMYTEIINQLPAMVATQTEFNFVSVGDNVATYELVTSKNGDTYSYEVIFVKDSNGIWTLQDF